MNIRAILVLSIFLLGLAACNSDENTFTLQPLDLSPQGLPITIMAPDSATVKKSQIGDWDDITVKKDAYSIQIIAKDAMSATAEKLKNDGLVEVKSHPFFSKILKEEDTGFLFENAIDSVKGYDFRYFYVKDDRAYTFRIGMADNCTKGQAKQVYEGVKQE